ncbi:hypothetical protein MMC07_004943 [Pseudocyphellaria aurata]|nr:hypothetical protein [Pseudocyphellaria aurata]
MQETEDDLFDDVLQLENTFYNEGYGLGVADGKRAGLVEGRTVGLEKGFEKYASMGRLNGKAIIWAERLPSALARDQNAHHATVTIATERRGLREWRPKASRSPAAIASQAFVLPALVDNLRLEKHIRTLYALVEPSSLSTDNTEEAVSDFDDRLKRAEGKLKIIEKITGETSGEEKEITHNNMALTSVEISPR